MASFKEGMLTHVAGSMRDRPVHGEPATQVGERSPLQRQGEGRKRLDSACVIRLDRIIADPDQPRTEIDEDALRQLAESLKTRGQLQPIRVRWSDSADRYIVIVGERRYRAAILAGMETIACVVATGNASPDDLLEDQLVENALRLDLKPIEQANAYRRLLQSRGLSQRQLADRLQIGHASIVRALALLGLPEKIRDAVEAGEIAANTAYELSKISDPDEQAGLARQAVEGRLKRDEIQQRTRLPRGSGKGRGGKAKPRKTTTTIRTDNGMKITMEHRKGITDALVLAALLDALAQIDSRTQGKVEAA